MSNIIGLGLDATDITRVAATIDRYGDRFLRRIFTDGEIAYCTRRREPGFGQWQRPRCRRSPACHC